MRESFDYAVAIRTLGTAGKKYDKLMDSIRRQTIQPKQVIVVLPEGYAAPAKQLGFEQVVYCRKGMIPQRIEALKYINCKYTLFCDDDVEPDPDFVQKLAEPLETGKYACSGGPLLDFFPPQGMKYVLASLLGGACVMLHGRNRDYVRILKTGGWSYNHSIRIKEHRIYRTESLPWTCFFIDTDVMRKIHFEDEMWAEKFGYAAFEDRVMFYKLLKNGYETCVVSDAHYLHNDAKSSTKELRLEPVYAGAFNHYVFWHRYIHSSCRSPLSKAWADICISYYMEMQKIYKRLLICAGRNSGEVYNATVNGFKDAKEYVNSCEYGALASAIIGDKEYEKHFVYRK